MLMNSSSATKTKKKIFQSNPIMSSKLTNSSNLSSSRMRQPDNPFEKFLDGSSKENDMQQHAVNRPFKIKKEAEKMYLDIGNTENETIYEAEEEDVQQYLKKSPTMLRNIIQNFEDAVKSTNHKDLILEAIEESNDETNQQANIQKKQEPNSGEMLGLRFLETLKEIKEFQRSESTNESELNDMKSQKESDTLNLRERIEVIKTYLRNKLKRGSLVKTIEEDQNNLVDQTIKRGHLRSRIENQALPIPLTRSVSKVNSLYSLREYFPQHMAISIQQNCSNVEAFSRITDIIHLYKYNQKESQANHKESDFKRISNLGKGRFGVVDLYEYENLGIPVAVKQVKSKDNFTREVFLMESINSAYKPKLFYFSDNEMQIYMETGLCSLEELRHHFYATGKKFTDQQAFSILMQVILSVEVLISQQSFHSDIKPSNIVFRVNSSDNHNTPELSILLIDYGGSSFEMEDYWTFFTPAFVCSPLMYRLSCNKCWEISNDTDDSISIKKQEIQKKSYNQEDCVIEDQENNVSQSQVIQTVYSTESNKLLSSVQLNASKNSKILSHSRNDPQTDSQQSYSSSFKKQMFSLETKESTEDFHLISSGYYENNNNNKNKNYPIPSYLSSENKLSSSKYSFLGRASPGNILKARSDGFDIDQILEKKDFSKDNNQYNTEWLKTLNVNFSKDSESNIKDEWLSWEEIRYAEVYAACRSVEYLILKQSDYQSGMFNKNQTGSFINNYKHYYPQTLTVIERIIKNKQLKLSKNDIKLLCFGLNPQDLAINLDPSLVFGISSVKQGVS